MLKLPIQRYLGENAPTPGPFSAGGGPGGMGRGFLLAYKRFSTPPKVPVDKSGEVCYNIARTQEKQWCADAMNLISVLSLNVIVILGILVLVLIGQSLVPVGESAR